jgi:DUF4097 and DUF4098 domain-containing protein YvlB
LLVAGGALLLVGGGGRIMGMGGGMFGSSVDGRQTYRATTLDLTGTSGDVRVDSGAAAGVIEVARHVTWGMGRAQPTTNEQVRGQTLAIDSSCAGGFMSSCSIDYVVTVPEGAQVTIRLGSGDVALDGALGPVNVVTGSGSVDATRLSAVNTVVRTGSGDLDLSFATAPSQVDLRAGSGDVTMWVPKGDNYAVDVTTGSGDRNVGITTSPGSSRAIHVQTGSGDVDLAYR